MNLALMGVSMTLQRTDRRPFANASMPDQDPIPRVKTLNELLAASARLIQKSIDTQDRMDMVSKRIAQRLEEWHKQVAARSSQRK